MNRSIVLAFFCVFIAVGAMGQRTEEELNPQDPKAKEILDALSTKATGYKSFKADFEYTLENKSEGINETQKGSVVLKGKDKYKVKIAGQEIVTDGKTVWTYLPDVGELQISNMPEESEDDGNMLNPANAFHMYKKGFKYTYKGTAVVDGRNVDVVHLYPMEPDKKPYHTVIVNVDKEKNELVSMVVRSKDGNTYTYKLKNFTPDVPVTDADFKFDESKAEDIIDLRE